MAFPGTYNINYYKGDTFQFKIYPKNADGSAFNLAPYVVAPEQETYDEDTNPNTPEIDYDSVRFVFAPSRGSTDIHQCLAWISSNKQYIGCAIRGGATGDSQYLTPGTEYVYDVQIIRKTNQPVYLADGYMDSGAPSFPIITTVLTGTITVQGQVTP